MYMYIIYVLYINVCNTVVVHFLTYAFIYALRSSPHRMLFNATKLIYTKNKELQKENVLTAKDIFNPFSNNIFFHSKTFNYSSTDAAY